MVGSVFPWMLYFMFALIGFLPDENPIPRFQLGAPKSSVLVMLVMIFLFPDHILGYFVRFWTYLQVKSNSISGVCMPNLIWIGNMECCPYIKK